jgi:hypothetical protein
VYASAKGTGEITGSFGPGTSGGDMPSQFHVQVAKDDDFADVVSDTSATASATALSVKELAPGTYFVRVSAIDADRFEGPFSAVRKVVIGAIKITPKGKRRATVEVTPNGAYCGVAGGPLAPIAGAFEIDTLKATSVRCAASPDGAVTVRDVPASKIGVRVVDAKVTHAEGVWDEGEVTIHLADSDNAPLDGVEVASLPAGDASVGVFVSAGAPGAYRAPARWKKGAAELAFSVHVGDEDAAAPPVALDRPPPEAPPPAPPTEKAARAAIEIQADGGPAFINDSLQQVGGRGRIGAGYGIRLGPGILALGIAGGFEGYYREEFPATDANGTNAGRVAVGQLHAFTFGIPIQYRYGTYESRIRPYVGITPELLFENASFSHLVGDHQASSIDQGSAKVGGLTGQLGAEVKLGPGAAYLELGYRGTQVFDRDPASVNMHGFVSGIGYRLAITY